MAKKITKERLLEIAEMFKEYTIVQVHISNYPKIDISLYSYDKRKLSQLIEILYKIKQLPEACEDFDTDIDYGYYDSVEDFKIEVTLSNEKINLK